MSSAIDITGLFVTYPGTDEPAVADASVVAFPGQTVAIVGESGSGKSTTAAAIAGLLDTTTHVETLTHSVGGRDVRGASAKAWRALRGSTIGFVPQDAGTGLNPVRTIAAQITGALRAHGVSRRDAAARIAQALADVGLDPQLHGSRHPHQLSGGQRQRALIALALAGNPAVVIADEPTSALHVTVQKQVLDLLEARVAESGAALILITHDLGVAKDRADEVIVMQHGRVVESGPTAQVLRHPAHAYTQKLLSAAPGLGTDTLIGAGEQSASSPTAAESIALETRGLVREFRSRSGHVRAVNEVSLRVPTGQTLGIVGESGSGKSITARMLVSLEAADAGTASVLGHELTWRRGEDVMLAKQVRFVHQDPSASLDPAFTVFDSIAEPLIGFKIGTRAQRAQRVHELLELVALDPSLAHRRPRELSGGQRQRVAIARALAVDPQVVVLDEPVSALDVSVQSQILELLVRLQRELALTYVFISHDLAVIRQIAHHVVVLDRGAVVEAGPTAQVFAHPTSLVTSALIAAVPGTRGDHEAHQRADDETDNVTLDSESQNPTAHPATIGAS